MILKRKKKISWFRFPTLLEFPDIQHGVFTRNQGYSLGPFRSMNVSFGVGDRKKHVEKNRQLVSQCMDGAELVFINQVHGAVVLVLQNENKSRFETPPASLTADAIVTDIPNHLLVMQVADCQSVLMFDPVQRVVANVHCGWRGTINGIIGETVGVMKSRFGCKGSDIRVGIGPSLGPCCAEFVNFKKEIPNKFWKHKDRSDRFDFWAISRDQLSVAGVLLKNIFSSNMCTRCRTDHFFSFRGEGTTGRFAVAIGLKNDWRKKEGGSSQNKKCEI